MTPYYDDGCVQIFHGDCRDILPQLGPVDHVITDPPYDAKTHAGVRSSTMSRGRYRRIAGTGQQQSSRVVTLGFDPLDVAQTVPLLLAAARRWVVAFCSMEMVGAYRDASGESWVRAGFWRRNDGAPQFTGDRPASGGDAIAIMHAPVKKRWNKGGSHGFWECGVERQDRTHPTQKPERLMLQLLADFTDEGETVLDPFMGSGTTLVAAKRLGRKAIGIERDEQHCETSAKRLYQSALDFSENPHWTTRRNPFAVRGDDQAG